MNKLSLNSSSCAISSFESLLDLVIKPSPTQHTCILSLINKLANNEVVEVFTEAATAPPSENSKLTAMVTNLVKVPDRTLSIIGLDQSSLPTNLYPRHYCSLLLKNMASAFMSLQTIPTTAFNPTMFCATIRQLFLNYPEHIRDNQQWWQFLAKWTLQPGTGNPQTMCQKVMAQLDARVVEKCLLALLKNVCQPLALSRIFGGIFAQDDSFADLLHRLFILGLQGTDTPDRVACLMGYLARVDRDKLDILLIKGVKVWNDEIEVDQGDYTHMLGMAWMICAAIGEMLEEQLNRVREVVTKVMMKGMVHWLETARIKRMLGMSVAHVVLGRVGGSVPDWEVEDKELLEQLSRLAARQQVMEPEDYHVDMHNLWKVGEEELISATKDEKVVNTHVIKEEKVEGKHTVIEDLDSDDDDDDLVAYDMSEDNPVTKDHAPIHYLREVIDHLSEPESERHEECLVLIPKLAKTHLQHEDPSLVHEVLQLVLCIHNQQDNPAWVTLRQESITSIVSARPLPAAKCLVRAVYDKESTLDTKFTILTCMQAGGSLLRESGSALLGDYLTMAVGGLCVGGGGAWGRLQVSGLDTSILAHTVLTLSSMVRMGEHTHGWEGQVTHYLEFLLAVAGSGKKPVQAAVLHGLGVVAALVPPHMLTRGRVGELLGEGARWAGQLVGELRDEGQNMKNMLSYKHQEGVKMQIERELSQPKEIKMKIDKKNIKVS